MRSKLKSLTALLALLLITAPVTRADDAPAVIEPYEAWFVMNIGGQKAGHMHVTLKQEGKQIISTTQMKIAIKRGQQELKIEQSSRFVEATNHKPIEAESSMALGAMATKTKLDFTGEKWKMTTASAGQENTNEVDPPGVEWLTPGALSLAMEKAIERGDKEITVTTLDLSMGIKPVTMTMKRGKSAEVEVFGRVVPATKWTTTMTALPGVEIEQWSDDAGQPVRQVVPMLPGMEMEMLLADKALALAEFDAPEMLAASLIKPDKPIKNPRKLKRAVFKLVSPGLKDALGDAIVSSGYQQAKWVNNNTLQIEIDVSENTKPAIEAVDKSYSLSSSMLNYKDQEIQKLIRAALKQQDLLVVDDQGAPVKTAPLAESLRTVVREHIEEKDLSVGFASASETARTGQGDCTEHACLLAAMLRGAGIPSRTVTGLVYADQFAGHEGVFGFHMWTQAWVRDIEGKGYWLDLDAAAPGKVDGFDATHIALSTSAMKDGETFNDIVTLLPLMKGLKIKVVETVWAE